MAATKITGVQGSVTIPAGAGQVTGLITRWTADIPREVHEASTFDDTDNARVKLGGMYDLRGSCEAWFDGAAAIDLSDMQTMNAPPTAGFKLFGTTGPTPDRGYLFDGIMSNVNISVEKAGQVRVTMSFESSYTTAQPDIQVDETP